MYHIGIRCTYDDFDLRRDLMLFDRLALPLLEETLQAWAKRVADEESQRRVAELEWLAEREIVFAPSQDTLDSGPAADAYGVYKEKKDQIALHMLNFIGFVRLRGLAVRDAVSLGAAMVAYAQETGDAEMVARLDEASRSYYDDLARAFAIDFNQRPSTLALPIMSSKAYSYSDTSLPRTDVLSIALDAVPFPASSTSLDKLIEFRSDPDVRADFLAFHKWAAATATKGGQPAEISEEIEYLLAQYQRHMRLHRIEQGMGMVETIVTTAAEAIEDLLKLKLSDAAKLLFSFQKRKVALRRAEMCAPGRELAYLDKAASVLK